MAGPETLCPKCAFSPIPAGAEKCPRCNEVFAFNPLYKRAQRMMVDKHKGLDFEATLRGALTGAVSAHPGPAAAVLGLCSALWLVRGAGLFVDLKEPQWLFGLAAFELCAATVLMANIGPAKGFAQLIAAVHIGVAFVLGAATSPHTIASAALGAVVFFLTLGEPSHGRRSAGLVLGLVTAGAAFASLVWVTEPPPPGPVLIEDLRIGYRLQVPDGWARLQREELAPHLPLPSDDLDRKHVGFGSRRNRSFGLLTLSTAANVVPLQGCQDQLRRIGGVNEATPLGSAAPVAFGKDSLMLEIRAASGATGQLACGRVGERFVTLSVIVLDPTPGVGAAAFDRVAAGLTVH